MLVRLCVYHVVVCCVVSMMMIDSDYYQYYDDLSSAPPPQDTSTTMDGNTSAVLDDALSGNYKVKYFLFMASRLAMLIMTFTEEEREIK